MIAWKLREVIALVLIMSGLMSVAAPRSSQAAQAAAEMDPRPAVETPKLEFDVASIRLSDLYSERKSVGMENTHSPYSGLFSSNTFLIEYIEFAYHISHSLELQNESLFKELDAAGLTLKYDIEARAEGRPTQEQMREMVQSLLEDRFKLRVHYEMRQEPIYMLLVDNPGQLGPQIHIHSESTPCITADGETAPPTSPQDQKFYCGGVELGWEPNHLAHLTMAKVTIGKLVDMLGVSGVSAGGLYPLSIVDATGLKDG